MVRSGALVVLAWSMYRTFVKVGLAIGGIAYLLVTLAAGGAPAVVITLPLIFLFCLGVSAPLAVVGAASALAYHRRRPGATDHDWDRLGTHVGIALVALALIPFLHVGALGSAAGVLFWGVFFVAGSVAGGRAGVAAVREIRAFDEPR
jgi:hypothetical protein